MRRHRRHGPILRRIVALQKGDSSRPAADCGVPDAALETHSAARARARHSVDHPNICARGGPARPGSQAARARGSRVTLLAHSMGNLALQSGVEN